MEFRILKIHSYDPIKNTFTTRKTGTLDDLEINVDQLFDAYDIIIVGFYIIRETMEIVKKILKGQNFFHGYINYGVCGTQTVFINNKLEKCTYWNSYSIFPDYYYGCYINVYHPNNASKHTFFKGKLPCIFIDYRGDIKHLQEYYKITKDYF